MISFSLLRRRHSKILSLQLFYPSLYSSYHQKPSHITPTHLNSLLNSASQTQNSNFAAQIHAQIIINNYSAFSFLLNNLLNLYAKCGFLCKTRLLFSKIQEGFRDVITWTSIITQLSHHNLGFNALVLFNQMRGCGVRPNQFTFSAVLSACAHTMNQIHGIQIHGLITKHGFDCDVFVGTALVGVYAKCCDMVSADKVFDEMPERNVVSWNSMIVGFLDSGLYDQAVLSFKGILREKYMNPTEVSVSSVLNACVNIGAGLCVGEQVHGIVVKYGLMGSSYVRNSLMDMYCKCKSFKCAIKLFRKVDEKDVVTWNVMMMGFVQDDCFEEAFKYFALMRSQAVLPDEASFSITLHACSCLAALNQGTLIHNQIIKSGFERNKIVASSLITMYSKGGSLVEAHRVFQQIKDPNVVCWTSMISAFQQHGYSNRVIVMFEHMLQKGIQPHYITFVSVLSACGHTGRVEEGFAYFDSMEKVHNMDIGHEHYASMVDLLGRAGELEDAKRFIESMPIEPGPSVWGALLNACRNHGNLELARKAAERLFQIEPRNPGNYVILANMYECEGKMKEADDIRRLMGVSGVRKEPGCSWIDMKNTTFVFKANDKSNSRSNEIYAWLRELKELVKKKGYTTNDVKNNKEPTLWHHSEKLALAFGILTLPSRAPIRIKKNLRTCEDCHTVMKLASEILDRNIFVRDVNRFHHFSGGHCSCQDYW